MSTIDPNNAPLPIHPARKNLEQTQPTQPAEPSPIAPSSEDRIELRGEPAQKPENPISNIAQAEENSAEVKKSLLENAQGAISAQANASAETVRSLLR